MDLLGAPALARLLLVDADQLAIVALVQGGGLDGGEPALAKLLENDIERVMRALERGGEGAVEMRAGLFQHGAGAVGLGHALFGEADILPAGEAVGSVPLALAMADENEHVLHGRGLCAVRASGHRLNRCSCPQA